MTRIRSTRRRWPRYRPMTSQSKRFPSPIDPQHYTAVAAIHSLCKVDRLLRARVATGPVLSAAVCRLEHTCTRIQTRMLAIEKYLS